MIENRVIGQLRRERQATGQHNTLADVGASALHHRFKVLPKGQALAIDVEHAGRGQCVPEKHLLEQGLATGIIRVPLRMENRLAILKRSQSL